MSGLSTHAAHRVPSRREYQGTAMSARISLIGAACGRGAKDARCADGPGFLQHSRLMMSLRSQGIQANWQAMLSADNNSLSSLPAIAGMVSRLAGIVEQEIAHQHFFTVIGGDHSCAIGTWSGAAKALHGTGPLGLIWLDAHMDSHTPETSPSGALHGMPLACLLGHGAKELTNPGRDHPFLSPAHVCLIGVRSFEPEEKSLLERLNVRVYTMADVKKDGPGAVMRKAFRRVVKGAAGVGISIDLDGIDPRDAPAVGSPVPGGIRRHELLSALHWLSHQPGMVGAEIAEFNPALDRQGKTACLIHDILTAITPATEHS